jgi:DNA-directed RNA polymerase subunit RPC12/RpoP
MGASDEIVCPYCSTHYVVNAKLKADDSVPKDAAWHD